MVTRCRLPVVPGGSIVVLAAEEKVGGKIAMVDGGVFEDGGLHLRRIHVLAAAHDQVVTPVDDV